MREDEDLGHHVPLLRRIIILVAVITAIPVVLWTITAFVRSYVGPPKIPTFHQLASKASINEPASTGASQDSTDRMMAAAAQQAKLADPSTATDAAPKGPFLAERAQDANTNAPTASVPASQPSTPIVTVSPAPAMTPAAAPAMSTAKPADSWPPMPAGTKTTELPMPPAATTPAPADTSAPNAVAAATQPPASEPAAEDVPAAAPLSGPVPLPKRRPRVITEMQAESISPTSTPAIQTEAPTRMASNGPIPMPRPRPDSAPVSTAPADSSNAGPLDFITNIFGGGK